MKWVRFNHEGQLVYGLQNGDAIQVTDHRWEDILAGKPATAKKTIAVDGVSLLNPVERPGKIVCVGLNYLDHCRETNTAPPPRPLLFSKFTTALNDPNADIVWSAALTSEVDFEAELVVVIGRQCRNVSRENALDYVAGYTAANDVSARDLQMGDGQWVRGKSLDTFCPLGPVFVSADEIPDPQALSIRCLLNDAVMQDSHTREMIFPVDELVSFCSQAFTLEPGDIILTGTPHGIGMSRDPKIYMQHGDRVVVEIEGIGRLENTCKII